MCFVQQERRRTEVTRHGSSEEGDKRADWLRFSAQQFANAYGEGEDEDTEDDIMKANPDYAGR